MWVVDVSVAIMAAKEHITAVTKERSYYRNICEESKKNIHLLYTSATGSFEPPLPHSMIVALSNDNTVHYSFDMAQQVIYVILPSPSQKLLLPMCLFYLWKTLNITLV